MFSKCQQWNDLPGEFVGAGSVNEFKRGLIRFYGGNRGFFWSSLDIFFRYELLRKVTFPLQF